MNLPFQIRRFSGRDSIDNINLSETIVAGGSCLSKFASFSKMRKPCLNFESTEERIDPILDRKAVDVNVNDNANVNVVNSDKANDSDRLNDVNETLGGSNLGKVVRKHPNLIGNSVFPTVQASKPKLVNEGNFVRLNINGHGGRKKFAYKVRKKNSNAYNGNRKSYKRSKRKLKSGGEGEEERSLCEEESLRFEENEGADTRLDSEVIERAVMDVRRDPCDENLVKLLKLTHGYDSFRDGQLAAIKLILDGKSSMVILPTGAGKSLCYQLPAIVLEGMTLVISPLVALMFDQLKQLPPVIPGGLLCSSQVL